MTKKNYQAPKSENVELLPLEPMLAGVGSPVSGTDENNPIKTE